MQFKSKEERQFIVRIVLNSVPDILVASLFAYFSGDDWFVMFLFSFIALKILYFALWIKNTLWEWCVFYFDRKKISNYMREFLEKNNFPEPNDYETSVESYLGSIVSSEDISQEVKNLALTEIATLKTYLALGEIQKSLRVNIAYEDALEAYKKTFKNNC